MLGIKIVVLLFFAGAPSAFALSRCRAALDIGPLVEALQSYHQRVVRGRIPIPLGTLQRFSGVGNRLVYNPTGEFLDQGRSVIAARVESLHDERQSEVLFFERTGFGNFRPIRGAPVFKLQDPFVTRLLSGEIIFGGVETYAKSDRGDLGYRTVFYRGANIDHLQRFAVGPEGMKDIRLVQSPEGDFILATRPQGKFDPLRPDLDAGPGMIGMTMLKSLDELTTERINAATLYPDFLPAGAWGGINEIHALGEGLFGVLGHVAVFSTQSLPVLGERDRNYYPFVATWDSKTGRFSKPEIILERADLPAGFSKRKDLRNVLFSGGLDLDQGVLWIGAGDAQVYRVKLGRNPFRKLSRP